MMRYKDFFMDFYNTHSIFEEYPRIIGFDFIYYNRYSVFTTLKKGYKGHWITFEFDLFRRRFVFTFGRNTTIDYDIALQRTKEQRKKKDA